MAIRGRPRAFDREQALTRAMEVFWVKGLEAASISDLTAAMGIVSPSLYAAFGSKEALFREAVDLYVQTDGAEIWSALTTAQTAYDAVAGFLTTTARLFSRPDKPSGCMVVLSALHITEASQAVRAEMAARRKQNESRLVERLARGVEAGEIASSTDLTTVARFYITVQQGMSIQARDGASLCALDGVARSALAAWGSLTASRH